MTIRRTDLIKLQEMDFSDCIFWIEDKFSNRKVLKIDYCYDLLDRLSLLTQYDIDYPGLQDKINKLIEHFEEN